ncbi:polyketide cyclase / dehydrase and lipid transport [Angustibacter sp. McL0619]|uniref:polyketide cyclase / dehydrase and lipid transport n=1 Tax=Angustibacter sp. McL0619 TaxID=3415676 RepID=UPI003CEA922D
MPAIDLVDDTFVCTAPQAVAAQVADPASWTRWWPDLQLATTRDRGVKGRQWRVRGALDGTSEIWLEPWRDGVLVHYYLRADLPAPLAGRATSAADRERRHRAQQWKRAVHRLKDALEAGRRPGDPADLKAPPTRTDERADER